MGRDEALRGQQSYRKRNPKLVADMCGIRADKRLRTEIEQSSSSEITSDGDDQFARSGSGAEVSSKFSAFPILNKEDMNVRKIHSRGLAFPSRLEFSFNEPEQMCFKKLDEGSVKEKFRNGLGLLVPGSEITGLYRIMSAEKSRQKAFERQMIQTQESRGDANVKLAWYGGSKNDLLKIATNGFVDNDSFASGIPICLASENHSRLSVVNSSVDDKGEQHVLLCQVILGKSELIRPGSKQLCPTSEEFDTGVDNVLTPTLYTVWMSPSILPVYIISFKLSQQWHEIMGALAVRGDANWFGRELRTFKSTIPCGTSNSFLQENWSMCHSRMEKLFMLLKPLVSAATMTCVRQCYADYKAGKVLRHGFIKRTRMLVGDNTLHRCARCMRVQASRDGQLRDRCF